MKVNNRKKANILIKNIGQLNKLKYLDISTREFHLDHNNFDEEGFKHLIGLIKLKTLLCGGSGVTGAGLV